MTLRFDKYVFILPLLSAALLILGFSDRAFWWVIFFALVPLFFFFRKCPFGKPAFLGGLAAGLVFYGCLASYFFSAYPLDWAGIESRWGLLFIFLIWLVCAAAFAVFFGLFGLAARKVIKEEKITPTAVLALAGLWVIFEYLKSWNLSILWLGPGSVFGPHWSIGHLGYVLANSEKLLQLAGWGGVYLLSFLAAAGNALIFGILTDWRKEKNRKAAFLKAGALIFILVAALALGKWELNRKNQFSENNPRAIKAALIQTDFPSAFREDFSSRLSRAETLFGLIEKIKDRRERFDVVIMNERHHFLKSILNSRSYADNQKIFSDFPGTILVDVKPGQTGSEQSSLLFYFRPETNQVVDEQEKIMLLPGGEYFPYLGRMAAVLIGQEQWLEDFLWVRGYKKGGELKVVDLGFGKVGGLLCSEILSPVLYRSLAGEGAELLINVASDSVFRGNPVLLSQNLAMAKVRAVESNRYFLQATNAGYSYIIDNRGAIKSAGKEKGNEVIFGEAEIISEPSFYAKTGDWIVVLSAVLFVINSFLKRK